MKNFPVACITGNHSKTYNYLFEKKLAELKTPPAKTKTIIYLNVYISLFRHSQSVLLIKVVFYGYLFFCGQLKRLF